VRHSIWQMTTGAMLALTLTFSWTVPGRTQDAAPSDMPIAEGKKVSFEYTLTSGDGSQIGTNVGQEPLVYTHGKGEIVPGLEKELAGLKAGDTKQVKVGPKEGYGELDPNRTQQVPIDKIPEQARKVGAQLRGAGQTMFAKVTAVDDKNATIDLNHPLAGKDLTFDVKILKVEEATTQ
jgi:FKBP-type peptidyl-prolyl cis-trans isomerase SlyD